jgi:hypothetical protein
LSNDRKDHIEIELDSNGYARNIETELSLKLS